MQLLAVLQLREAPGELLRVLGGLAAQEVLQPAGNGKSGGPAAGAGGWSLRPHRWLGDRV